MDRAILKRFAMESRKDLMEKIKNKIEALYIDEELSMQKNGEVYILTKGAHILKLSKEEYNKRELLIKRINELGLEQVIEEAAYTWFNRIVAIRYMEIHDYLPLTRDNQSLGIRVLSSKDNTPDPEIMKFTNLVNPELDIDFKKEKYVELKDDNEKFKYILLLVCRKLGRVIPQVFDGVTDYIDILVPDNLLNKSGFVNKIITEIAEENYEQVEIIGWLYQYYNQAEKDRVMGDKNAYKKNEIPYVTQLFTPDWIVKYLVENTMGKYWIDHQGSKELVKNWKYFVNEQTIENKGKINPENIKFLDPCCGSGHILVYAFEIMYQIYESVGYNKKDIVEKILKNNLYGLDIDNRAEQLSILALLLKAREYDKQLFSKEIVTKLNITSFNEGLLANNFIIENVSEANKKSALDLINIYKNSKEFGTLLKPLVSDCSDLEEEIKKNDNIFGVELRNNVLPLIKQNKMLKKKYNVIVTNPPYLNSSNMEPLLKTFIQKNYAKGKNDLFAAFIEKCLDMKTEDGIVGMITMQVWMFTSSFEELRKELLNKVSFKTLIQIGFNSFPELNSKFALASAFTMENYNSKNDNGIFYNLNVDNLGADKEQIFLDKKNKKDYFKSNNEKYENIDGHPIAYWASEKVVNAFKNNKKISDISYPRQGLAPGENDKFLRLWFEVDKDKIGLNYESIEDFHLALNKKYAPYNKGGNFRKWYGNNDYVIAFDKQNYTILSNQGNHLPSKQFYFKPGITWSFVNLVFGCRYFPNGFVFDVGGSSVFPDKELNHYMLGFLNSRLSNEFLKILNPTLNFQVGNVGSLPFIVNDERKREVDSIVEENIKISQHEWDISETSINFKNNILVENKKDNIKNTIDFVIEEEKKNFDILKNNEEKLNDIFFDIYDIDEYSNTVNDKFVSYEIPSEEKLVKNLINYTVGVMFGRYKLNGSGIVCCNSNFNKQNYDLYIPDDDNIIPVTSEPYFKDDIVNRFKDIISIVFGKEKLFENLDYIASILGRNGVETSEETIRRYFLNEYYKDHCDLYSITGSGKRPIYWLLDSGKKNGFKALIYMHRYNENLIPKARLDYLHRVQTTYEKLLSDVNYKLTTDLSMVDKKDAQKRQADLNAKLQEIKEYDEKIAHIANQRISIDLDDGVKINYEKFKDILAKIK